MNWDWDKLKQRQQKKDGGGGGIPPQMDKYINKFKEFKLPGMPLLVLIFIILFFSCQNKSARTKLQISFRN
jgi:membrane protease subunit HflK